MNHPANTRDTTLTRSTLSLTSQAGSGIPEGAGQPDDQQEPQPTTHQWRVVGLPWLRPSKATTMIESFNGFAKWLNFGNATIGTNDPEDQEKYIKFNTLVANLVILSTAVDMSRVFNGLRADGRPVRRANLVTNRAHQQENVRRFGDFVYDLTAPLETIEARLDIDDDDETGEADREAQPPDGQADHPDHVQGNPVIRAEEFRN